MDIKKIDKNFDTSFQCPEDIEWFSVLEKPFALHGIYYSEDEGFFRRDLPKEIADATNDGVAYLSKHSAGGRLRFETDSPYIVVRATNAFETPMSHMPVSGASGFALYTNGVFLGSIMPYYGQFFDADPSRGGNGEVVFDGIKHSRMDGKPYLATLYFPLYNTVKSLFIGLKKGCALREAKPYTHQKPVLFYGSSITQGACATKPSDDYINRLSRKLDFDYINLGFSGSAGAEKVMVDYIASQDPSVFVLDYDHNAPDAEHLKNTHYAFYETVRKAHPTTPIIMMTMPTIESYERFEWFKPRREEIFKSFERAKATGDTNLYMIDCYGCFGEYVNGECGTVDDCHPDSLGFLRMTERVYPVLDKLLNGK